MPPADTRPAKTRFAERLRRAIDVSDSLLCVGLDPQPERTPAAELLSFNRTVIEATAEFACAFKPQSAFYEAAGPRGWEALARTIELIRELAPHALVILDAKRGDIAHTARAYATAAFEQFGADAITASPYLGGDSIAPFLEHPEHGAFVLCRTSNPGGGDFQSLRVQGGDTDEPLYERVARRAVEWADAHHDNVGLVVGATWPAELARVRELCPELPILLPGIGAQGGDLEAALAAGLDAEGRGLLVSASRSVIYAGGAREIGAEAARLREAIHEQRERCGAARGL